MPGNVSVTSVEGLAQLRRDLKAIEAQLPKELQKLNKRAAETVAARARAAYADLYRQRSGTGAGSIRALAGQTPTLASVRAVVRGGE